MNDKKRTEHEFELLKIGELAAMAGISVKALHIYEQKDIIKPVEVDPETGYRYYSADQLKQVESLIELQDMGFTLNEIQRILSGKCSLSDMLRLFDDKQVTLQETIWKTEAKLAELETMRQTLENGSEGKRIQEMTDEERAWYLAKLVCVNDHNVRQAISEAIWL